jgi:hypothetical protein
MATRAMAWVVALATCEAGGRAEPRPLAERVPAGAHVVAPASPASEGPTVGADRVGELRLLVTRRLRSTSLSLSLTPDGAGWLLLSREGSSPEPIPCDVLTGAWGLWVDDVDDDGMAEAIVALHKPARFDPAPANRLHVYGFEDGRCVPAWRGTRLAGRFDGAATDPDDRGALVVHEWLSPERRRVARYRWRGFGYAVERVLWEGTQPPPAALVAGLDFGPSPHPAASTTSPGDPS